MAQSAVRPTPSLHMEPQPQPSTSEPASTGCWPWKKKKTSEEEEKSRSRRPKDTPWRQQELPACKPVLQPFVVVSVFLLITVVFITIGGVTLAYGLQAREVSARYDDACLPGKNSTERLQHIWENGGNAAALGCKLTVEVEDDMDGPVYVYYEIRGMHQNHRRYVRSHSDQQLAQSGDYSSYLTDETQSQNCVPVVHYPPFEPPKENPPVILPCGLVAWTTFNDTYSFGVRRADANGTSRPGASLEALPVASDSIAFSLDVSKRFADVKPQNFNPTLDRNRGGANITGTLKEDQRFINWMRLAHMTRFRKLWGRIDHNLRRGDLVEVDLTNQYNIYSFEGEKHVVLSTTTWLGGRSIFLGVAYLSAGGMSLIFALVFWLVAVLRPRQLGDVSALGGRKRA